MATINDVAKLAGVAASTVSRVLAGSSRISPETHEKVREAMKSLNYHPNAIARSLARKSTQTVGFLISRPAEQAFANPFFSEVIRGIGTVLHDRGFYLLLATANTPAEERTVALRLVRQRRVDGMILASARSGDRLVPELSHEGLPFVLIGRSAHPMPISWVNNDNVAVGTMAAEHLLERSHRRVGFIGGQPDTTVDQDRRAGYRQTLNRAGIAVHPDWEREGGFTKEGGYRAMSELMALPEPPTAVFSVDDSMALGALQWLQEHGEKVALVGVNDDPLAAYANPPLSTVRLPIFDLGAAAAATLADLITGGDETPQVVMLPSQLVVRASSDWALPT